MRRNVLLVESSNSWENKTRGEERRHRDTHKSLVLPASAERHLYWLVYWNKIRKINIRDCHIVRCTFQKKNVYVQSQACSRCAENDEAS